MGFAVFRFMFTKRRKKVVNPRAHPLRISFLPQTYLQENAIQPRVNQSLGPSHANPFPENKSNCFAVTWGAAVIKFIHMCMGKFLPESVWLKICWWKKVIDQTFFWQKTFKKQGFSQNQDFCWINTICFTKDQYFLNNIKIF